MIKLFIRNKFVELLNKLYGSGDVIKSFGINCGLTIAVWGGINIVLFGMFYLSGLTAYIYVIPNLEKVAHDMFSYTSTTELIEHTMTYGVGVFFHVVLGALLIALIYKGISKAIPFFSDNVKLAKNGTKVKCDWK